MVGRDNVNVCKCGATLAFPSPQTFSNVLCFQRLPMIRGTVTIIECQAFGFIRVSCTDSTQMILLWCTRVGTWPWIGALHQFACRIQLTRNASKSFHATQTVFTIFSVHPLPVTDWTNSMDKRSYWLAGAQRRSLASDQICCWWQQLRLCRWTSAKENWTMRKRLWITRKFVRTAEVLAMRASTIRWAPRSGNQFDGDESEIAIIFVAGRPSHVLPSGGAAILCHRHH